MAEKLRGAPVAAALNEKTAAAVARLKADGIVPGLAVLRVGERPDDIAYEQAAEKRCAALGIAVIKTALPQDVTQAELTETIRRLNGDPAVHGILLLRPLPKGLDERAACAAIRPEKDADGVTGASLAGVFTGSRDGFPPCTAQSCMEILRYYGIPLAGKHAVVLGRSLVIGRPVAALLLAADATVTICHSRTEDAAALCRAADIVVAATGRPESVGEGYLSGGQVVLDVGMSWNEEKQKLSGDVDPDAAEKLAAAYTPAPGGVGTVTAAVLAAHVAEAAERIR
ncbi:MAG: bifunctional 5,10-methylenetetrahydrofolate dehydrogenase/5,10-methenyltetrahydrofolate cyclohydrolase [Oscillospiraceae bacterium]|nr:bifunctional 5,10-methylenetetrahydrofolate dehydrogenase/5,10-methenyltetrahydrofolate cyclohydrolase [Oscillospiraceae bacterium]